MSRETTLEQIKTRADFPVVIIGAGINGISVFRELAAQGVDALLIDKGDYCSGASAASSHMLHGGIRYLENGEFRLVREAVKERNRMLKNAPHLAAPLPTVIPIFSWFSGLLNAPLKFLNLLNKPNERGGVVIKIGLIFYDLFIWGDRVTPWHKFSGREASLAARPALNPYIKATAQYYDGSMPSPERICMDLIRDAKAMHEGAIALNYLSLAGSDGETITLRDELTGDTFDITPQIVVNAAGPWIDFANDAIGRPSQFIGGTKGSHLVVDHPELHAAANNAEIFFENDDGRIVLIFPIEDRVLMGTTDIAVENPDVVCTDEEIEYILQLVKKVFPSINVTRDHIVYTFSGVRPLPAGDADKPGQISRDHVTKIVEPNHQVKFPVYSLVGGKWTTFRAFGEQVADKVLKRMNQTRTVSTEQMPIGGGKDYPKDEAAQTAWVNKLATDKNLTEQRARELFERYGTYAAEVADFITQDEDALLENKPDFSRREVMFVAETEDVARLDDFIMRRSLLAMLGRANKGLLEEIALALGVALGWDAARQAEEVQRVVTLLKEKHLTEVE